MRPAASGKASARSSSCTRSVVSACSRRALSRSSLSTTCTVSIQTKKRTKTPKRHAIKSPKAGQIGVFASCSAPCIALPLPTTRLLEGIDQGFFAVDRCLSDRLPARRASLPANLLARFVPPRELAQRPEKFALETELPVEQFMGSLEMDAKRLRRSAFPPLDDERLDLTELFPPGLRAFVMRVD